MSSEHHNPPSPNLRDLLHGSSSQYTSATGPYLTSDSLPHNSCSGFLPPRTPPSIANTHHGRSQLINPSPPFPNNVIHELSHAIIASPGGCDGRAADSPVSIHTCGDNKNGNDDDDNDDDDTDTDDNNNVNNLQLLVHRDKRLKLANNLESRAELVTLCLKPPKPRPCSTCGKLPTSHSFPTFVTVSVPSTAQTMARAGLRSGPSSKSTSATSIPSTSIPTSAASPATPSVSIPADPEALPLSQKPATGSKRTRRGQIVSRQVPAAIESQQQLAATASPSPAPADVEPELAVERLMPAQKRAHAAGTSVPTTTKRKQSSSASTPQDENAPADAQRGVKRSKTSASKASPAVSSPLVVSPLLTPESPAYPLTRVPSLTASDSAPGPLPPNPSISSAPNPDESPNPATVPDSSVGQKSGKKKGKGKSTASATAVAAESAAKDKIIAKLQGMSHFEEKCNILEQAQVQMEKEANMHRLKPRPSGRRGTDWNLQVEMGLSDNKNKYNEIMTSVRECFYNAGIDVWKSLNRQEPGRVSAAVTAAKAIPGNEILSTFEGDWVTKEFFKQTMREKRKKLKKLQEKRSAHALAATTSQNAQRAVAERVGPISNPAQVTPPADEDGDSNHSGSSESSDDDE
ncbi:hypothetical protein FRB99_007186 [Tulasnella sp. 403]|nr:hypothetical protein FRB99_007186 [Tulasnella sp. 403]